MIYRAKVGLQNSKQIIGYSPSHSPSNRKKTITIKQNKNSPKPCLRENKQNIDQKQMKSQRFKQQKYFKISKQQPNSTSKKQKQNTKINIFLNTNQKQKVFENLDEFKFLNIQTPKFKCSSNKLDDRCKTDYSNNIQNYFSFGQDFRQNISNSKKQNKTSGKVQLTALKQRSQNIQQNNCLQKFSINSLKKKQKIDKIKQVQQKLQMRFLQIQKQIKQNKFKKDRDVFCFKK